MDFGLIRHFTELSDHYSNTLDYVLEMIHFGDSLADIKKYVQRRKKYLEDDGEEGADGGGDKKLVIAGFPGVGKTYFKNNTDKNIQDSDSSLFSKSPDFPNNYIEHIKNADAAIVLVSTHKVVREALVKNNIVFTLVYPQANLKEEYLERFRRRGSPERFLGYLEDNWDGFIKELGAQDDCAKIILCSKMFLSDILPYYTKG